MRSTLCFTMCIDYRFFHFSFFFAFWIKNVVHSTQTILIILNHLLLTVKKLGPHYNLRCFHYVAKSWFLLQFFFDYAGSTGHRPNISFGNILFNIWSLLSQKVDFCCIFFFIMLVNNVLVKALFIAQTLILATFCSKFDHFCDFLDLASNRTMSQKVDFWCIFLYLSWFEFCGHISWIRRICWFYMRSQDLPQNVVFCMSGFFRFQVFHWDLRFLNVFFFIPKSCCSSPVKKMPLRAPFTALTVHWS